MNIFDLQPKSFRLIFNPKLLVVGKLYKIVSITADTSNWRGVWGIGTILIFLDGDNLFIENDRKEWIKADRITRHGIVLEEM